MRRVLIEARQLTEVREKSIFVVYDNSSPLSERMWGFERRVSYRAHLRNLIDTLKKTDKKMGRGNLIRAALAKGFVETDELFDWPLAPLGRLMLTRDSYNMLRVMGWSESGNDRYRLYTRDFEQFADTVEKLSSGQARPTKSIWSMGNIVNLVGPTLTPIDTLKAEQFEAQLLEYVRGSFEEVFQNKTYGIAEDQLLLCKSNIENYIWMLSKNRRAFTTPYSDSF